MFYDNMFYYLITCTGISFLNVFYIYNLNLSNPDWLACLLLNPYRW